MVRGAAEGYDWALRQAAGGRPVDEGFVKDVHERTALDCQPRTRGTYRTMPVYIAGSATAPARVEQVRPRQAGIPSPPNGSSLGLTSRARPRARDMRTAPASP